MLDGVTSLLAAGMQNWSQDLIDVTVAHNRKVRPLAGVRHHHLRDRGDIIAAGLPRTKPDLAVVRGAQWAATDRQAATIVAMAVQQRLVHPTALLARWERTAYAHRREVLDGVIADVCNGAHSLSELDFTALCRRRGLPEPSRQTVRSGPRGGSISTSTGTTSTCTSRSRVPSTSRAPPGSTMRSGSTPSGSSIRA